MSATVPVWFNTLDLIFNDPPSPLPPVLLSTARSSLQVSARPPNPLLKSTVGSLFDTHTCALLSFKTVIIIFCEMLGTVCARHLCHLILFSCLCPPPHHPPTPRPVGVRIPVSGCPSSSSCCTFSASINVLLILTVLLTNINMTHLLFIFSSLDLSHSAKAKTERTNEIVAIYQIASNLIIMDLICLQIEPFIHWRHKYNMMIKNPLNAVC